MILDNIKLKPCPFCGGEIIMFKVDREGFWANGLIFYQHEVPNYKCLIGTMDGNSHYGDDANGQEVKNFVKKWNTRRRGKR